MHRRKTQFARRLNRVLPDRVAPYAKALENRGIRATYELHDRVLSNRKSRQLFAHERLELDEVQRRIVAELDEQGFSLVTFADLFPGDLWSEIEAQAAMFISETEADLAAGGENVRVRQGKEFVVRLHSYDVELGMDDPWFRACASDRMLDIANAYLRMWSKLEYVDEWYSVPQPAAAERISSQRWHRDFNDKHLLKAFLHLVDVDVGMGPFQYVAGSQPGGPYADAWAWRPLGQNYPTEEELEQRIPASAVQTFTGPKASLLFCNTCGFHRGGFSTTDPRVLATVTYSSPASLASLTERSYRFTGSLDELDAPTRFGLA
jgi:ectoine hydroxylase-related dioxygenase (phytanoyl-CoA dioxygenase family)